MSGLNGILPVDKPAGPTSHDVVAIARRALGERRIGHTGTLDPFATGLLVLCIGPATRLSEYLTALPKQYVATMKLGVATSTDDLQGEVLASTEGWQTLTLADVERALAAQVGTLAQRPPDFSAKRVGGERMYDRARRGEMVDVAPTIVTISRIELLRFEPPEVDFQVDCASGTYIRSIARDVGEALQVGAHLTALRRTGVGPWTVGHAIALDALSEPDSVRRALIRPAGAVAHLPLRRLLDSEAAAVRHGRAIPARAGDVDWLRSPARPPADRAAAQIDMVAMVTEGGDLLAIGELAADVILPRKVFQ